MTEELGEQYTNLLEIDTFKVIKDEKFDTAQQRGQNNFTEHWIAHMCDAYLSNEDENKDMTGVFDAEEIREGHCYYCKLKIPEPIIALWSMLEWKEAADILHQDAPLNLPTLYKVVEISP